MKYGLNCENTETPIFISLNYSQISVYCIGLDYASDLHQSQIQVQAGIGIPLHTSIRGKLHINHLPLLHFPYLLQIQV